MMFPSIPLARPTRRAGFRTILAILAAIVLVESPGVAHASGPDGFRDAHGVYEFEDGGLITLYGVRPTIEMASEEIRLSSSGPDRYQAATGSPETITLIRDASGAVTGVDVARTGERPKRAIRANPYAERPVAIARDGIELAGSLLVPSGGGPHPAIAIVHGAEFGTRETYRLLASHLARRGVAALIYDKRGTGDSTGDFSSATFASLTGDALAVVSLLRSQPDVHPDRVGLAGMSQGGWIIANAAIQSPDVAFLVALSASGFTPAEQAAWLTGSMLAVRGFGQADIDRSARAWAMLYSSLDLVDAGLIDPMPHLPGFWFHALDPHLSAARLWERVEQPVLGLWGELDCQVPAFDSLGVLRDALDRGPNDRYSLRIYPGADHGMAIVGACEREIGHGYRMRHFYPDGYLAAPAEWIHSLTDRGSSAEVSVPTKRAPSPLGWHQSTRTDPSWHGSFPAQVAVFLILVAGFGAMTAARLARLARHLVDRRLPARPRQVWGAVAVTSGFIASLSGGLVLIELLTLADLWSNPIVGGSTVSGTTPLARFAGVACAVAIGLGVAALAHEMRRDRRRRLTLPAVGCAILTGLLVYWSAYWGLIVVPGVG